MKLVAQCVRGNRGADIGTVLGKFNVVCYEDGKWIKIIECHEHSESYAVDVGTAWVEKRI